MCFVSNLDTRSTCSCRSFSFFFFFLFFFSFSCFFSIFISIRSQWWFGICLSTCSSLCHCAKGQGATCSRLVTLAAKPTKMAKNSFNRSDCACVRAAVNLFFGCKMLVKSSHTAPSLSVCHQTRRTREREKKKEHFAGHSKRSCSFTAQVFGRTCFQSGLNKQTRGEFESVNNSKVSLERSLGHTEKRRQIKSR